MKLSKHHKPELCASTDPTRPAFNSPYLDGNTLVATDGRCLIAIPVETSADSTNPDTDGSVPIESIKAARRLTTKSFTPEISLVNGKASVFDYRKDKTAQADREEVHFPDWQRLMPDTNDDLTLKVSVNPAILRKTLEAIDSRKEDDAESVTLEFKVGSYHAENAKLPGITPHAPATLELSIAQNPIRISTKSGTVALVMPMRLT